MEPYVFKSDTETSRQLSIWEQKDMGILTMYGQIIQIPFFLPQITDVASLSTFHGQVTCDYRTGAKQQLEKDPET